MNFIVANCLFFVVNGPCKFIKMPASLNSQLFNMKSVLDKSTRDELIVRINKLGENSKAHWGQMNVYQMLKHCVLCEELYLGKTKHKRAFMGRLFGKMGLKNILREDKEFPKNAPTSNVFKVKETDGDVANEKQQWIALIEEYLPWSAYLLIHNNAT